MAAAGGSSAGRTFLNSPLGQAIADLSAIAGFIVVVVALFKGVGHALGGSLGKALKVFFFAAILAAALFNLGPLFDVINTLGSLLTDALKSLPGSAKS